MEAILMSLTTAGVCLFGFFLVDLFDRYLDGDKQSSHHRPQKKKHSFESHTERFFR
jgi:hypothetical protein